MKAPCSLFPAVMPETKEKAAPEPNADIILRACTALASRNNHCLQEHDVSSAHNCIRPCMLAPALTSKMHVNMHAGCMLAAAGAHVVYASSLPRIRLTATPRPAPTPMSTAKFLACTSGPPCCTICICLTMSAHAQQPGVRSNFKVSGSTLRPEVPCN